ILVDAPCSGEGTLRSSYKTYKMWNIKSVKNLSNIQKGLINSAIKILKPGGKVIITTPNCHGWGAYFFGQRWINWHVPYHRQFFSEKSINIVAEKAGLQTIKIRTITSSEWLHYQWIHLKMFPQKSTPSVFWSNRIQPKIFEKIWLYIFSLIHKFKFNHFITRFFDIIGLGDSKIYILEKK
ncbi:MAG: hypothetical protein HN931_11225, partial [Desulfobacterales bacterium]|nr:hypothetical protein [Desulfobacterales bacterium]